jgi:hypothetical protein
LVSVADDGTDYLNDKFESAPRTEYLNDKFESAPRSNNYRDDAEEQSNVIIEEEKDNIKEDEP